VFVVALLDLLAGALDRDETRHLTNDRFDGDLRAMRARVESELEDLGGGRLRLVEPHDLVSED
jgi:hypothetical protein